MGTALAGRRILIPRSGQWGSAVVERCAARGAVGVIAPIIESRPPHDTEALESRLSALQGGRYAWLFVTSAASVEVLLRHNIKIPDGTAIAAVGQATSRALERAGYRVAFAPSGVSSAHALVEQWKRVPRSPGSSILVMRSDLAAAMLSDALEAAGHLVGVCIAYRTVGVDLSVEVLHDIAADRFDAILVTSQSVAFELGRQLEPIPASTLFASLGDGTAREATRLGLTPGVTAAEQTIESLLDAVERHFTDDRRVHS